MVHQELADLLRLTQIAGVQRLAIHHRVAVKSPRLTSRPRAAVSVALMGVLGMGLAGDGVVADDVERGIVLAEVVLHRCVGMTRGYALVVAVARLAGHEAEHFQVHHVVDDDGILPLRPRFPRLDDPQTVVPAGKQALRAFLDDIEIVPVAGQPVALPKAAV